MGSNHEDAMRGLFEEVGIMGIKPPTNPIDQLGISHDLATELLKVDPTGQSLQLAARGMFRALSTIYHPDTGVADVDRLNAAKEANDQVQGSTATELLKLSAPDIRPRKQASEEKVKKIADKSRALFDRIINSTENPFYFSEFEDSNGLVVHKDGMPFLLQPTAKGQLRIVPTSTPQTIKDFGNARYLVEKHTTASKNIRELVEQEADKVGYDADKAAFIFVDEDGRTFIYDSRIRILSEASETLAGIVDYIKSYPRKDGAQRRKAEQEHYTNYEWALKSGARLLTIPNDREKLVRISRFDEPKAKKLMSMPTFDFKPVGSVKSETLVRVQKGKRGSGLEIESHSKDRLGFTSLSVYPISFTDLLKANPSFMPVLAPGDLPVVRDGDFGQLRIIDARIVGLFKTSI